MNFIINNEEWRIRYVSPTHPSLYRMSKGDYTLGCCDDNNKTIYLNEKISGSLLKKVLCHEIAHAAMFSYNINLSYEQEELVADLIATYGNEIIYITNKIFNKLKRGY